MTDPKNVETSVETGVETGVESAGATVERAQRGLLYWLGWVFIVVSAVLYGYAIWSAVGNLILFPQFAASLGLGLTWAGWFWLILQITLPVLIAGFAVLIGRKQTVPMRALILIAGVALVSVLSIDIMHSIPQTSYFG